MPSTTPDTIQISLAPESVVREYTSLPTDADRKSLIATYHNAGWGIEDLAFSLNENPSWVEYAASVGEVNPLNWPVPPEDEKRWITKRARRVVRQKTQLKLPESVVDAFAKIDTEERDIYIAALKARGWTLQSIADVAEMSRERVRQIVANSDGDYSLVENLPLPQTPVLRTKPSPVYVEPSAETLQALLDLQPQAEQVRANSPQYRAEGEEYARLIDHAHRAEGVSLYRLALRLGRTHGALRFRLARYGYKTPASGGSKVYTPIKEANRVLTK